MHLSHFIFTSLMTIQVYYLYKFIYSIPLRYEIPETETDINYTDLTLYSSFVRRRVNDSFHGTHKQKHLRQPHQEQTRSDNNTASTYMSVTTLDVVGRF